MSNGQQREHRRQRHRLLPKDAPRDECGSIKSVEELGSRVQTAIEIEHSTIPPLTALYSISSVRNAFACQTIQSVVMEEMLHMTLAANILNAVGGHPAIDNEKFIPEYPTYLPHSDETLSWFLWRNSPGKRWMSF